MLGLPGQAWPLWLVSRCMKLAPPLDLGFEAAALGFTLAMAAHWAGPAGVFWAGEDAAFAEEGAPYPRGARAIWVADLDRLIVGAREANAKMRCGRLNKRLAATGAIVICALGSQGKARWI